MSDRCQHEERYLVMRSHHLGDGSTFDSWDRVCLACSKWLDGESDPQLDVRIIENKLGIVIADLCATWEPGEYRNELIRSAVDWAAVYGERHWSMRRRK